MLYITPWVGLSEPSWEREIVLHFFHSHTLRHFMPELRTRTAKTTAFTAGCRLVRHSVSSPGTTGNVF